MNHFTILGATGFIGSHLVAFLRSRGFECLIPRRDESLKGNLGHVVYCIGLTADFRARPLDTMEAHVSRLIKILGQDNFASFLYLSSTRVYQHLSVDTLAEEHLSVPVNVNDPSDLYNLSKLAGESLCLANNNPKIRIARLSNVYGDDFWSDNFLSSILREGLTRGHIELKTTMESSKDYIIIDDVVYALQLISSSGRSRLYNVAYGQNVSHADIMRQLGLLTGCSVSIDSNAVQVNFPRISIQRLQQEFNFNPSSLKDNFNLLVDKFKEENISYDRYK
jgi:nucleoside-diphosphate-sugar epimerase